MEDLGDEDQKDLCEEEAEEPGAEEIGCQAVLVEQRPGVETCEVLTVLLDQGGCCTEELFCVLGCGYGPETSKLRQRLADLF